MAYLTKAEILAADDLDRTEVEVPEWGGVVLIQAPTAWEMSEFQNSQIKVTLSDKGKTSTEVSLTGSDVKLAALCIVNESGEREFTAKDVQALGKKSPAALGRVVKAIRDLTGVEEAMEVLEGNSEPTP